MNNDELCKSMREAAEAASNGPWLQFDDGGSITDRVNYGLDYADCVWTSRGPGHGLIADCSPSGAATSDETTANARHIALANPQNILALLDERDRLREALSNHVHAVDQMQLAMKDGINVHGALMAYTAANDEALRLTMGLTK